MTQYSVDTVLRLSRLFEGYDKAHGSFKIERVNDKGKNEGKALTHGGSASPALWGVHLAGTGPGLGVIPLLADNTVRWAVIDIDVIGIDHKALEAKIKKLKLPLVVCCSKSGGAHCFLFLREPIDARLVVEKLTAYAAALGHGGCEIFPKQVSRYDEEKDVGNWLNMPYFFAEKTNRYAIKDGEVLSLSEFLEHAASMSVTDEQLAATRASPYDDPSGLFVDAPPCLQTLYTNGGFGDGTRNDGMYNVAVYLKKRYSDDWQDRLATYNADMCDPPLTLAEINVIVKSVGKKDYFYKCSKPPIKPHCERSVCKTRACGIGDNGPEIGHLTKYVSDPVLWFLGVDDKRIMLETRELTNQRLFQERVSAAVNRYPRTLKQADWEQWLDTSMRNCSEVEVPEEASTFGQFKDVVHMYCRGQARTTTKEQLAESNSPFITGDGEVWFKAIGLQKHLNNQGFKYKSMVHVYEMLRKMGCRHDTVRVKPGPRGTVNVWVINEAKMPPESDDGPGLSFSTEEF